MSDTSSAPLDAAPEASSSFPSPPPVLVASLASLPTELKARIAAHASHPRRRYDASAVRSKASKQKTSRVHDNLLALSKVDSVFHELCAPWVWERIDLTNHSDEDVLHLVQHTLPRVGKFVKSFTFRVLPGKDCDSPAALERCLSTQLSTVETVERLVDKPAAGLTLRQRKLRTRDLLAATSLRLCPNINALHVFELSGASISELCAIIAGGAAKQVERLQLSLFAWSTSSAVSASTIATMISSLPKLRDIQVRTNAVRDSSDPYKPIYTAIAAMPHLRCLHFGGPRTLTDSFFRQKFTASVSWMSIGTWGKDNHISFAAFRSFIAQHRETLYHLDFGVDLVPVNRIAYHAPLDLPKLSSLELTIDVEPDFLTLFSSSPIEHFRLNNPSTPFSLDELKPFLDKHRQTLSQLVVEERIKEDIGAVEIRQLQAWCTANGVDLVTDRS